MNVIGFSVEFTFMSDTILSTLASKQTSPTSEDQDQIMDQGEGKQGTGKSQGRNREKSVQMTVKQENSWRAEDICEDDEETDNSSIEPDCGLPEYGLSPLTSSPRSEAAEPGDGETAVEATTQTPRCSVDKVKERLDLRRNKKPSEESRIQFLTGGRADVSLPFSEDSEYNDRKISLNSWRQIAQTLGKSETACRQKWKSLRDRYVKAKTRRKGGSSKTGRRAYIISMLDWLSGFIKHRSTEETRSRTLNCSMAVTACTKPAQVRSCPWNAENPHLPLSSVRLLVPPLRLMSACMWQVAQERNVDQYDKLAEFIILVTEMVPELLDYKQKTQLILGLSARLILELLKTMDEVDCKAIQDHLNSFQQTTNLIHEEDPDGEVETSKSAFVELVQTLLEDQSEKENFFKEVFPVQYGACFDKTLQIQVWEFFHRLEEFLPVPRFSQVCSMFDISSLDEEFEQFLSDPEDLKRILQHQQERQKLTKSEFTMSDTILSTLASKQTSPTSEDQDQIMDQGEGKQGTGKSQGRNREKSVQTTVKQENRWRAEDLCEDDEETDNSSIEPNCGLPEYGLSPLTSSPCSEAAEPGDGGEHLFHRI
ncbi:hypothetical protein PFLUV_G00264760 [Perca fluviatilis]|uniref:Uncharacterized protein n=1 Tax=Perca fluviatilis TaxID=8168 RepID=A0A6A5E2B3_PERFL|nr:hypothetical protein PFLUV_G00264760 [Perca fluviatilis]